MRIDSLTREHELEFPARREAGDVRAAWDLVLGVRPTIRRVAIDYQAKHPHTDIDDLVHAGIIGAFVATRSYDPERGAFRTHAWWYARGYMAHLRGHKRTLGLDPHDARLETPIGDDIVLGDLLPSPDDRRIDERIDAAVAANIGIRDLQPRERFVIERRAMEDSLESIAIDLGVSRARVHQIERTARTKARRAIQEAIA